jgi:hypothetical protein
MKTSILRTLATLSLSAVLGPVSLRAQGPIHITVPFDFTVGSKSLAAGKYEVRRVAPMVVAIQSADGRSNIMTQALPGDPKAAPGKATLTFNQYGDRYFLSQVSDYGHGWELPKSSAEKELIAKRASPRPVTVAAGEQ